MQTNKEVSPKALQPKETTHENEKSLANFSRVFHLPYHLKVFSTTWRTLETWRRGVVLVVSHVGKKKEWLTKARNKCFAGRGKILPGTGSEITSGWKNLPASIFLNYFLFIFLVMPRIITFVPAANWWHTPVGTFFGAPVNRYLPCWDGENLF